MGGQNHDITDPTEQSKPIMFDIVAFFNRVGITQHKTRKSLAIFAAIHSFFVVSILSCLIPQFLVVLSGKYDMFDKAEAMSIILPMGRVFFHVLNRLSNMSLFWELYDELQRVYDVNSRDPLTKSVLEKKSKRAQFIFKFFMGSYVLIFTMFTVASPVVAATLRMLGYPGKLKLAFKAEYYIDTTNNPAFAIAYAFQTSSAFCSIYVGAMDSLFLASSIYVHLTMAVLTAEFERLSDDDGNNLVNEDRAENRIVSKRKRFDDQSFDNKVKRDTADLKTCIEHHITVIAIVKKFESVFSAQLAMEYLTAAAITCLAMFQVTYSSEMAAKSKYVCLATFFYGAVYIQFYHGQTLLDESSRLVRAVAEVPWAGRGPGYGRMVVQALQRAQSPLGITAMHLFVISLENYLKLLKTTFSYLALLQSVAEE